jgi:tetratricopeptide (TPR) repeat protein
MTVKPGDGHASGPMVAGDWVPASGGGMNLRPWLLNICVILALVSCGHTSGKRYLDKEEYEQGILAFQEVLRENSDDPEANYYMGRFYLAQEKGEQAMPYLQRATELEPGQADYHFWQGVAYWAVMDLEKERLCYLRALALDKKHVPAHLYLGHNLLDNGKWEKALVEYDRVVEIDPYNPEALYNRGIAFRQLHRPVEEVEAWKQYLKLYPEGKWALRAADHLNFLGDFSYRNFTIGYRRVTLERIGFAPGTTELLPKSEPSLAVLGSIMSINRKIDLEIVGHKEGEASLARARAEAVRVHLLQKFSDINPSRLVCRGEGTPERVQADERVYLLHDSIAFVTTNK